MARELSPTERQMALRVEDAQRLFNRVLVSWAGDVLELRRRKLLQPEWHRAIPAHPSGTGPASQGGSSVLPMKNAA